jgi:hypothetical protein
MFFELRIIDGQNGGCAHNWTPWGVLKVVDDPPLEGLPYVVAPLGEK